MNDNKLCAGCTTDERDGDGYEALLAGIRRNFSKAVKDESTPLFTTEAPDLYAVFLESIPADARQHYNCNACRHFVNRFGSLVAINPETGKQTAVMWGGQMPEFFRRAVKAVKVKVEAARITGVFMTSEKALGYAKTGVWTHMAVDMPQKLIYRGKVDTAGQKAAQKNEDRSLLLSCIKKYKVQDVESAVNLLRSGSLYQGEKILPMAEWFLETMRAAGGRKINTNILWYRAATAPAGFCHIPASMVGTLLDDIAAGYGSDEVKRRFDEKMHPLKYQRPKADPSEGNVRRAEEIVEKMGLEPSLERRFARLDEVKAIWKPAAEKKQAATGGVFAGVPIKGKKNDRVNGVEAPEVAITFDKFRRTVLPGAQKIELLVGYKTENYAAIVTAVHEDAPPIIRWDFEDERNPFSWYLYNGGSYPGTWGLSSGWNDVTAVVLQPNMWSDRPNGYASTGAMFVLKGARDTRNPTACLFPNILKGELHEVRATIEAYSNGSRMQGKDEASVCGLLIQNSSKWLDVKLRVTSDVGVAHYKIDRWD